MLPFRLFKIALLLAFVVVVVGAFVRLSDAGLGCPDWPGCYGQLLGVADAKTAAQQYAESEYDSKKAWIEVSHRYIAGILAILLCIAAVVDWRVRRRFGLPQVVFLVVIGQAVLGMLTVTEKLRPIIVIAHLLGGMLILALLAALVARRPLSVALAAAERVRLCRLWAVAVFFLVVQIALGGWVSANYAGLACPDFPLCHGGIVPPTTDFSGYFPWRELHKTVDGGAITAAMLQTIHWVHRVGALFVLLTIGYFAYHLRLASNGREALGLVLFLVAQIIVGILNVVWQLPLFWAVAHNALAAVLVINISVLRVKLSL